MQGQLRQIHIGVVSRLFTAWRSQGLGGYLTKQAAGSLVVRLLETILRFASAVLLARLMNPDGYGIYVYAISIVTLLTIPIKNCIGAAMVRFTATYHAHEEWGQLHGL